MKEILSFYVGQAGVQTGSSVWELFCAEHNLTFEGRLCDTQSQFESLETFFHETSSQSWVPRSLFVDLEPTVIDEIRNGSFKKLFHPDRLLNGHEDAANNFSRGFFTVGKLLLGTINTEFRHLIEQCDMAQGMLIMRSLGGGTGAGLTSAMFESFDEYPKTPKIEIPIYPSPTLSTSMVEPYNCLLGEHFCMEDIDVGLLLDNEAMFDVCSKYMTVTCPTYNNINRLIAQIVSSITASIRFENILNCDLTVLQTNLVPYPRIHFPLCNFAPFISQERANHQCLSVQELTRLVFERDNQMMKIDHFYGKFMSCALFFRGNVCPRDVYVALSEMKKGGTIEFVDWCPTGFKVGINSVCPVVLPDSNFADTKKNVAMLTNTSAIGQAWQRLTHRFYLLYSKRSFVHWFVGEGMEECEFTEALYNVSALVKDYEEAGENTRPNNDNITTLKSKDDIPLEKEVEFDLDDDESVASLERGKSLSNSTLKEKWHNSGVTVNINDNCCRNEMNIIRNLSETNRKCFLKYSKYRHKKVHVNSSSKSKVLRSSHHDLTTKSSEILKGLKRWIKMKSMNSKTQPYPAVSQSLKKIISDTVSRLQWLKSDVKSNKAMITAATQVPNSNTSNKIVSYPCRVYLPSSADDKPNQPRLRESSCQWHTTNFRHLRTNNMTQTCVKRASVAYKSGCVQEPLQTIELEVVSIPEKQTMSFETQASYLFLAQCAYNDVKSVNIDNVLVLRRNKMMPTIEKVATLGYKARSPVTTDVLGDNQMMGIRKLNSTRYSFVRSSAKKKFISTYSFENLNKGSNTYCIYKRIEPLNSDARGLLKCGKTNNESSYTC